LNLLFCGPPATGKSHAALERFRAIPDSWIATPTATMAEHLSHELARSGFPVRPARIGTLARLLDAWSPIKPAPRAVLHALIDRALDLPEPSRFTAVADFRGFHAAVADLLEEGPLEMFARGTCGPDLAAVSLAVEQGLSARGMGLRNARLKSAAANIRSGAVKLPLHFVFDGFFTFSPAELELLEALCPRTSLTVTLPEFPRAANARARLEASGFEVRSFSSIRRTPRRETFRALTAEREAEEIARRILEQNAGGRRWREIGIVLRSREPYGPLLETTLARFGIPAQAYFTDPLSRHPAIAFLSGLVRACLSGWDHAELLALMRMPISGWGATNEGDAADFAEREKLPGKGLPFMGLEGLEDLDLLRGQRLDPAAWAERLKELQRLIPAPAIFEHADRDQVQAWRSTAAALKAFSGALEQAAAAFPASSKLPLNTFWKQAETVLALERLRLADHRRDVVHLMDVFEARQWELPVVFVCGLLEREFPRYHSEDPVLGDAARRRLGMETAAQRNAEERSLFDLAVTRASSELVLSFSRFDEKGVKTLPSFFLEGFLEEEAAECGPRIQPEPARAVTQPALQPIQSAALLGQLGKKHRRLSASSVESFLQCPFQFFAEKTLKLRERPPAPRDRMDFRAKGSIVHRALAERGLAPLLPAVVFDRVFEDECSRLRIPGTYRTEAARLELLRHFEAFVEDAGVSLGWRTQPEVKFEFPLNELLTIRGRIDRLDISPEKQALVIDYKYSASQKVKERVEASDAGELVQAGVYLLAAEKALELKPIGMLYCGLKKEITWNGWHVPIEGLERIGTVADAETLREKMDSTVRKIEETYEAIAAGRVAAQPADTDKCRWCAFRNACRVESILSVARAGAAS
jgi:ATP-dependent helicase/DNAse subunit B